MKTFSEILNEGNSFIKILPKEANELLRIVSVSGLRSFIKQNDSFVNIDGITTFIEKLDEYNDKIFENWEKFIIVGFKRKKDIVFFDMEALNQKFLKSQTYKKWYNQMLLELPIIFYLVRTKEYTKEAEASLQKIVNKFNINQEIIDIAQAVEDDEFDEDSALEKVFDKFLTKPVKQKNNSSLEKVFDKYKNTIKSKPVQIQTEDEEYESLKNEVFGKFQHNQGLKIETDDEELSNDEEKILNLIK